MEFCGASLRQMRHRIAEFCGASLRQMRHKICGLRLISARSFSSPPSHSRSIPFPWPLQTVAIDRRSPTRHRHHCPLALSPPPPPEEHCHVHRRSRRWRSRPWRSRPWRIRPWRIRPWRSRRRMSSRSPLISSNSPPPAAETPPVPAPTVPVLPGVRGKLFFLLGRRREPAGNLDYNREQRAPRCHPKLQLIVQ